MAKKDWGGQLGASTGKSKGVLGDGLMRCSAPSSDKSTQLPTNMSVNSDATRSSVGRATNNLGPREG